MSKCMKINLLHYKLDMCGSFPLIEQHIVVSLFITGRSLVNTG